MDLIQQAPPSLHSHQTKLDLKFSLDESLKQEEILWRNKSRGTWLVCKDLNTKFFYVSTLIKRRRIIIDSIKLPSGDWISDRPAIGEYFIDHFKSLFSSSMPSFPDALGELFVSSIIIEENLILCSIPSKEEIYNTLTSIHSTKAPGPDGYTTPFYKQY